MDLPTTLDPLDSLPVLDTGNGSFNHTQHPPPGGLPPASVGAVVALSMTFCVIGLTGLLGNFLIIWVVVTDRKMRNSVTNMFITNMACADFLIMMFGIPEIIQVS